MPRSDSATTIETLGDLRDHGYALSGWCDTHGFRDIDLPTLIASLGPAWGFVARRIPVKCSECGRPLATQVQAPTPGADLVQSSGRGP